MKKIKLCFIIQFMLLIYTQIQAQQWEWIKHIGSQGDDACIDMVIDNNENIYAIMLFSDTCELNSNNIDSGTYIIKINNTGNINWVKPCDNTAYRIATDNYDNIYLLGTFQNSCIIGNDTLISQFSYFYGYSTFLAKYDSSFNPVWAITLGPATVKEIKIINDNIYMSSYFQAFICDNDTIYSYNCCSTSEGDVLITRYTLDGNCLNYTQINNYGNEDDCPECCSSLRYYIGIPISIDSLNNVYASIIIYGTGGIGFQGHYFSTPSCNISRTVLCKFDSSFTCKYAHVGNIGQNIMVNSNQLYSFSVNYYLLYDNDITVLSDTLNLVVAKINNNTGMLDDFSSNKLGGTVYGNIIALSNLTIISSLSCYSIINNDTITSYFYNGYNQSMVNFPTFYILKYDTALNVINHIRILDMDSTYYPSLGYARYYGKILFAKSFYNKHYISTHFLTNVFMNNTVFSTYGGYDIIIGKLIDNNSNVSDLSEDHLCFNIYPNPSDGNFEIKSYTGLENSLTIEIFDGFGRKVYSDNSFILPNNIKISNYIPGIYYLRISSNDKVTSKTLIFE